MDPRKTETRLPWFIVGLLVVYFPAEIRSGPPGHRVCFASAMSSGRSCGRREVRSAARSRWDALGHPFPSPWRSTEHSSSSPCREAGEKVWLGAAGAAAKAAGGDRGAPGLPRSAAESVLPIIRSTLPQEFSVRQRVS